MQFYSFARVHLSAYESCNLCHDSTHTRRKKNYNTFFLHRIRPKSNQQRATLVFTCCVWIRSECNLHLRKICFFDIIKQIAHDKFIEWLQHDFDKKKNSFFSSFLNILCSVLFLFRLGSVFVTLCSLLSHFFSFWYSWLWNKTQLMPWILLSLFSIYSLLFSWIF